MLKKRRFRLVSSADPGVVFDDLDKLRDGQEEPHRRRQRSPETFARIPHDRALKLYSHRLPNAAWIVMIELDRIILKHRGQNPVRFVSSRLKEIGLTKKVRKRAFNQLAAAGVINVEYRRNGLAPLVTHRWFPLCD